MSILSKVENSNILEHCHTWSNLYEKTTNSIMEYTKVWKYYLMDVWKMLNKLNVMVTIFCNAYAPADLDESLAANIFRE